MKQVVKLIATFFFSGYLPFAPGTWASLFTALLVFAAAGHEILYLSLTGAALVLGFLSAGPAEKIFARKDAPQIVIDEVAGMFIACLFIQPTILHIIIAFFLFRFFDILKPSPVRNLEKLGGGAGIMLDDIAAGIYANIALRVIIFVLGKI